MAIELRWSHGGTGGDVYVCDGPDGCGLDVRQAGTEAHTRFHDRLAELDQLAADAYELAFRSSRRTDPGGGAGV